MNSAVGLGLARLVLTRRGRAWRGLARPGAAWLGLARLGVARMRRWEPCSHLRRQPAVLTQQVPMHIGHAHCGDGATRSSFIAQGSARHCKARPGASRLVAARLGSVGHGEEGRGDVHRRARFHGYARSAPSRQAKQSFAAVLDRVAWAARRPRPRPGSLAAPPTPPRRRSSSSAS